jgi:hypothetical protein
MAGPGTSLANTRTYRLNAAALEKARRDPHGARRLVLKRLAALQAEGRVSSHVSLQCRTLLGAGIEQMERVILSETGRGRLLRELRLLEGVLSPGERYRILLETRVPSYQVSPLHPSWSESLFMQV